MKRCLSTKRNLPEASEETTNLEIYLKTFLSLETVLTLNIHTYDEYEDTEISKMEFVECCELLLITVNNSYSLKSILKWRKTFNHILAKLTIISYSERIPSMTLPLTFSYSQVLFILLGKTAKGIAVANLFTLFTTAEEFIATDPYEVPELYWPALKLGYPGFSIADFPLLIGSEVPTTGLLVYFSKAFQKYYENRRDKHKIKNVHFEKLEIKSDISDFSDGYPLKISKVCFMVPVIDEISQEDFLKKPFQLGFGFYC
uniref:Uncharacterized protein n=1 Tax=Megaselia scalaris TaxID=36166 RepID=T1GKL1_MEGSC